MKIGKYQIKKYKSSSVLIAKDTEEAIEVEMSLLEKLLEQIWDENI